MSAIVSQMDGGWIEIVWVEGKMEDEGCCFFVFFYFHLGS